MVSTKFWLGCGVVLLIAIFFQIAVPGQIQPKAQTVTVNQQITNDSSATADAEDAYNGPTTANLNHAANVLIVITTTVKGASALQSVSACTVGGVSATQLISDRELSPRLDAEVWYIFRSAAANETVSVSATGKNTRVALVAASFTGTAISAPFFEATNTNKGSGLDPQTGMVDISAGTTGRRMLGYMAVDGGIGRDQAFAWTQITGTDIDNRSHLANTGNIAADLSYRDSSASTTYQTKVSNALDNEEGWIMIGTAILPLSSGTLINLNGSSSNYLPDASTVTSVYTSTFHSPSYSTSYTVTSVTSTGPEILEVTYCSPGYDVACEWIFYPQLGLQGGPYMKMVRPREDYCGTVGYLYFDAPSGSRITGRLTVNNPIDFHIMSTDSFNAWVHGKQLECDLTSTLLTLTGVTSHDIDWLVPSSGRYYFVFINQRIYDRRGPVESSY